MKFYLFFSFYIYFQVNFFSMFADLPIHCLKSQTTGKWKFEFTAPKIYKNPFENNCGHNTPDLETTSFKAMSNTFKSESTISFDLMSDGCVEYLDSSDNNIFRFKRKLSSKTNTTSCNSGYSTAWTMVYDEGFEIRYKGIKMFTFSYYFKVGDQGRFKSNCAKTCVGWYHNTKTNEMGCFRGHRIDVDPNDEKYMNNQTEQLNVVEGVVAPKMIFKSRKNPRFKSLTIKNRFEEKLILSADFKEHYKIVNRINSNMNNLWVADVYDSFQDKSIAQLNRMAGRSINKDKLASININNNDRSKIKYKRTIKEDVSDLPKNLSWAQYLPEVGQQGGCGSCYAISTLKMLEARIRIKEHVAVELSEKFAVECSYYNQGCEGGYSFLLGRFGEENVFINKSCNFQKNAQEICSYICPNGQGIFKIKDYWYIGGSYGECNERKIMQEIMNNGPVVLSFEPDYIFMLYKKGIYHEINHQTWMNKDEQKPEWYKVDHSVVCYGWGEENGNKYWLLMNSWGKTWGENGHFRMKRGDDELGIEFIGESAIPYLVKNDGF